jgi:hypothetical protein
VSTGVPADPLEEMAASVIPPVCETARGCEREGSAALIEFSGDNSNAVRSVTMLFISEFVSPN